jgi:hypothetical protein
VAKGYQAAVSAQEWLICDGCNQESARFLPNLGPLDTGLPAGWSRLEVRSSDPIGEDETYEYCATCTLDLRGLKIGK